MLFAAQDLQNPPFTDGNGTIEAPFIIKTAEQLAFLAERVNAGDADFYDKHYELFNDVDLSGYGANWNDGAGWMPIGNDENNPFVGVFNGAGHKITGLYINVNYALYKGHTGLFGYIKNSVIKNMGVEGVSITGVNDIGGLAGHAAESEITNCYTTGEIAGLLDMVTNTVGSIAGTITGGVYNSYSSADINGMGKRSGGIVASGNVYNSYFIGNFYGGTEGGIAYGGNVKNSVALNKSVYNKRVVVEPAGDLSNNAAFMDMEQIPHAVNPLEQTGFGRDGENITREQIYSDGTIGGRFTAENGWTVENGKLPGLFGKTVDMPGHLLPPEVKNGWGKEDGIWYWFVNGEKVINDWIHDGSNWYFMGETGAMAESQWITWGGDWFYVGATGAMLEKSWLLYEDAWFYLNEATGAMANSNQTVPAAYDYPPETEYPESDCIFNESGVFQGYY